LISGGHGQARADCSDYPFTGVIVASKIIPERNAVRVQAGDAATITFNALPGVSLSGAVADVKLIGENRQGEMTYAVTIIPSQPNAQLRWNMTASVTIAVKL
jgi:hypothetical protein